MAVNGTPGSGLALEVYIPGLSFNWPQAVLEEVLLDAGNHEAVLVLPTVEGRCALAKTAIEVSVGLETDIRLCLLE